MTGQDAQALVDQGIQQLIEDPTAWEQWASTYAKFPRYSPGNVLLIMQQRPDASYVAGYHAWQSLGRQVAKGEHGIGILAPIVKKQPDPEQPKAPAKPQLVGFRAATVFDVSQTQGRELNLPQPKALTGNHLKDLLAAMIQSAVPVPVSFVAMKEAYGVWSPTEQRIQIKEDADPNQQLKTLIHEWSHSLGVQTPEQAKDRHVGTEEITAETTAYILSKSVGLDTTEYSQGYVGSWSQGDPKKVLAVQSAVAERVHAISDALQAAAEQDPVIAQAIQGWQVPKANQPEESAELSI